MNLKRSVVFTVRIEGIIFTVNSDLEGISMQLGVFTVKTFEEFYYYYVYYYLKYYFLLNNF
jgi:hypothetical protein